MFEKFSPPRRTALENALLIWTILSVLLGLYTMIVARLDIYGGIFGAIEGSLLMGVALGCAGLLVWHLRKPTSRILYFGIVYWALQIASVRLGDMHYAFSLGLKFDYRVIDTTDITIKIDLLAGLIAYLFYVAADHRAISEFQAYQNAQIQPPTTPQNIPASET
ncbi:hypothetical protein [Rhodanobacter sp. C03]|uniref:hypothetical protein n=1 Tax=Rhodanobacter sp. C03 TaxID=1945858 RepID=UPI0011157498|nr:hypothetical protein [Rhodanobacter sp. C03]